jgi:hypothetical protein
MPNAVKYSTTVPTGSLLKGTVALGVTTSSISGPTSTTGWYYGPNSVAGKYQIFETAVSGDPDVYCPQSDAELIQFVKSKGATGANTASLSASLAWIGTQTNLMAANFEYPNIVTSGLIAALDASFVASYPTTGSTIYDISGQGANGTLNGTVTWVSSGSQSYFNFAASGLGNYISSTVSQTYFDCTIVMMPDFSTNNDAQLAGLIATTTPAVSGDKSLRFAVVNGTGPWSLATRNPGDGNDWANPSATTYYVNGSASNVLVSGWNIFGGYRTNTIGFPATFPYFLGSGGYSSGNRGFQGKIAVALLYNRQLSAAEQTQNYTALRGRFGL